VPRCAKEAWMNHPSAFGSYMTVCVGTFKDLIWNMMRRGGSKSIFQTDANFFQQYGFFLFAPSIRM